jgi:hypothetical protein
LQSARIVQRALLANGAKVWTAPPFGKDVKPWDQEMNRRRWALQARSIPRPEGRPFHDGLWRGANRRNRRDSSLPWQPCSPDVRSGLGGVHRATADVTDYREIKAPAQTAKRTDRSLSSALGALVAFAAAAVVAITFSLAPASDGPARSLDRSPDTAFCTFRGEFRPEFRSYLKQRPANGESRCPFATRL